MQCCGPVSYVCGRPVASRVWAPQRYQWCHNLAKMLRVLHTVSSQMLAKLKQNQPWEIHLHFHGLQKIISFLFCYPFFIHVWPLLYTYLFLFSSIFLCLAEAEVEVEVVEGMARPEAMAVWHQEQ